jgi:CheY-like chemotaxis protein/glycine cleavage system H lipoate-binding protein
VRQTKDILVIDDEPMITQVVEKVCTSEGMTVTTASNVTEALSYLEECNFRLALCDIMMHDLDGFQFLEELVQRGIDTPVVMMTGYSTMENAVKSLASTGSVDYIPKPFTADELLTVIHRSLRCGKLLEEAESASLRGYGSMSYVPCPADYYKLGYVSWLMMEDEGIARIGVSDLFLKAAQGIQTFELAAPGDVLVQGVPCAVMTSADGSKHEIMCPMGGKILEINERAQSNPAIVEKDPYFKGWLYRVLPSNTEANLKWLTF